MTDEGLARLGALTGLQSLHLGGACALGELTCAMLAAHLPALTSLRITDCASLDDRAALRLQPLAGQLAQLALNNCEGVTDRSLERLLRKAARLSRLELAGCHRNITGLGLHMSGLCRLRYLNLACCDAITGAVEPHRMGLFELRQWPCGLALQAPCSTPVCLLPPPL